MGDCDLWHLLDTVDTNICAISTPSANVSTNTNTNTSSHHHDFHKTCSLAYQISLAHPLDVIHFFISDVGFTDALLQRNGVFDTIWTREKKCHIEHARLDIAILAYERPVEMLPASRPEVVHQSLECLARNETVLEVVVVLSVTLSHLEWQTLLAYHVVRTWEATEALLT